MSVSSSELDAHRDECGRSAGRPWFLAPWLALPLAEMLALTLRFDIKPTAWGRWGRVVELTHYLPQVLVAVGVATLLSWWLRRGEGAPEETERPRRLGGWVLAHLVALAGFVWVTAIVLEGGPRRSGATAAWVAAWGVLGLATLLSWGAVLVAPEGWGRFARRAAGPLAAGAAVGLAAWGASRVTGEWWRPLSRSTFWAVHGLLRLAFRDTVCRPTEAVLGTRGFLIEISPACSGYEGIGLIAVFLGAYLWLSRKSLRLPRALLLLPIGLVLIWTTNALRIFALVLVGVFVSPRVAVGGFHSQAGWLAFNAVALGMVATARRSAWLRAEPAIEPAVRAPNPTATYLLPLLALVAATMIGTAFSSDGFDRWYPFRVLAVLAALMWARPEPSAWRVAWSWPAFGIGVIVFTVWMALEPLPTRPSDESPLAIGLRGLAPTSAAVWLIFRVVGSVVTVPIAEELAFRGYLARRLIAADFTSVPYQRFAWVSFLGSSLLFGLMHGRWVAGTLAGMAYALAVYRRGRLSDAILAHATTNALIAATVFAAGDWALWE